MYMAIIRWYNSTCNSGKTMVVRVGVRFGNLGAALKFMDMCLAGRAFTLRFMMMVPAVVVRH